MKTRTPTFCRAFGLMILMGLLPGLATATSFTWTAAVNSDWNHNGNWSPVGVPGPGDDVTINGYVSTGNQSFNSLTINGGVVNMGDLNVTVLNMNGGTLNVGACTMDTLNMTGGTLASSASVDLKASGVITWTGGYVGAATGGINIPSSGALNIPTGLAQVGVDTTLTNAGTVNITGGQLRLYGTATFHNQVGASCLMTSAEPFTHYYGGNTVINDGLFETNGADVVFEHHTYELNGETRVTSGLLRLRSTVNINNGSSFTGAGLASLRVTSTINGSCDITGGSLELKAGTLTGNGSGEFVGSLSWVGGDIASHLNVPNGSSIVLSGPTVKPIGVNSTIDNHGTVTWQGGGRLRGNGPSTFHNHSDGVFQIAADGEPFDLYYGGNIFQNDGLLIKNGGAGGIANLVDFSFTNSGEFSCTNGTLRIDTVLNLPAGSSITGTETVAFNGDVRITGACTETVANLKLIGGSIAGTAPGAIVGTLTWEAGNILDTFLVPNGSLLEVTGGGTKYLGTLAVLEVEGTLRWLGTGPLRGYDRSTVNIRSTGVFDVAADGSVLNDYYEPNYLNVEGRLVKTAGTGSSDLYYWTIHSTGEIGAETGTLGFYAWNHLDEGCWFSGAGTIVIGGETYLNGGTICTPQVSISSGTFHGNGGVLNGDVHWSGGTITGTVVVGPTGEMLVDGSGNKNVGTGAVLQVQGEVQFTEGNLYGYDNSRVQVASGGRFEVNGGARFYSYFNTNTLEIQTGGLFVETGPTPLNIETWAVDNHGQFTVQNGGVVNCGWGGHSSGTFTSEAGGLLNFSGGDHYLQSGGTTEGPGEVRVSSGAILAEDTVVNAFVRLTGGRAGSSGESGEFRFKDGSSWERGYLSGTLRIPIGVTVAVEVSSGLREMMSMAVLTNEGTLRWEGGGPIRGYENSTIVNASGARLEFQADGSPFVNYFTGNVLENHGVVEKTAGTGDTDFTSWSFTNDGAYSAVSGALRMNAAFELQGGGTITGAGRVRLIGGTTMVNGTTTAGTGTLELAGATIQGHANGTGALAGGGLEWTGGTVLDVLTISGDATTAGGSLKQIGGEAELRVTGSLTVAGIGSLRCYQNSTLRNMPGGTLRLTGEGGFVNYFTGNTLRNEGRLELGTATPAIITIPWTFEQTATGVLEIGLMGGVPTDPGFDQLVVNGTATLAGTVEPVLLAGYDPIVDATFDVVRTTGGFGSTAFTSITGTRFSMSDDDMIVTLTALNTVFDYDTWAADKGLTGPDAAKGANPDGDRLTNWGEYVFNCNPLVPDAPDMTVGVSQIDSQGWLVLRYRVWQNRLDAGVQYQSSRSSDLQDWNQNGLIDEVDPDAPTVEGTVPRRARVPVGPGREFLQVIGYDPGSA